MDNAPEWGGFGEEIVIPKMNPFDSFKGTFTESFGDDLNQLSTIASLSALGYTQSNNIVQKRKELSSKENLCATKRSRVGTLTPSNAVANIMTLSIS